MLFSFALSLSSFLVVFSSFVFFLLSQSLVSRAWSLARGLSLVEQLSTLELTTERLAGGEAII